MRLLKLVFAGASLLAGLAACGTTGGVPPDHMNPQAPQPGLPFPYSSPWCQ
jgi:hypothetical protein